MTTIATTPKETKRRSYHHEQTSTIMNSHLVALPKEIKWSVCSFLTPTDVVRLSRCCKNLRQECTLSAIGPILSASVSFRSDEQTGDKPKLSMEIPILHDVPRIHSIGLSCYWRDQGWGPYKGQIYILALPKDGNKGATVNNHEPGEASGNDAVGSTRSIDGQDANTMNNNAADNDASPNGEAPPNAQPSTTGSPSVTSSMPFESHRLVWESSIALHISTKLRVTFAYDASERYYLWYKAGKGGVHELHLGALEFHVYCMDAPERPLERSFDLLRGHGIWSTLQGTEVVKHALEIIVLQLQIEKSGMNPNRVACVREYGLDVEDNPRYVGALAQLCASITKEAEVYAEALKESLRTLPPSPYAPNSDDESDHYDDRDDGRYPYHDVDDDDYSDDGRFPYHDIDDDDSSFNERFPYHDIDDDDYYYDRYNLHKWE